MLKWINTVFFNEGYFTDEVMSVLSKGDENHLYVFNKYATREKCSINNKNKKIQWFLEKHICNVCEEKL